MLQNYPSVQTMLTIGSVGSVTDTAGSNVNG